MHESKCVFQYVCMHVHVLAHVSAHMPGMSVCAWVCICIDRRTAGVHGCLDVWAPVCLQAGLVCVCIPGLVCTQHACVRICAHTHKHTHIHKCVYLHTHIDTHTYIYTYIIWQAYTCLHITWKLFPCNSAQSELWLSPKQSEHRWQRQPVGYWGGLALVGSSSLFGTRITVEACLRT